MKKKVFSLMAVVLFMGSSVNLNASDLNLSEDNSGCYEYADKWATIVGFWNQLSHYDGIEFFQNFMTIVLINNQYLGIINNMPKYLILENKYEKYIFNLHIYLYRVLF